MGEEKKTVEVNEQERLKALKQKLFGGTKKIVTTSVEKILPKTKISKSTRINSLSTELLEALTDYSPNKSNVTEKQIHEKIEILARKISRKIDGMQAISLTENSIEDLENMIKKLDALIYFEQKFRNSPLPEQTFVKEIEKAVKAANTISSKNDKITSSIQQLSNSLSTLADENLAILKARLKPGQNTKTINDAAENLSRLLENASTDKRQETYRTIETFADTLAVNLLNHAIHGPIYHENNVDLILKKLETLQHFEQKFRENKDKEISPKFEAAISMAESAQFFLKVMKIDLTGDFQKKQEIYPSIEKFSTKISDDLFNEKYKDSNNEALMAETFKKLQNFRWASADILSSAEKLTTLTSPLEQGAVPIKLPESEHILNEIQTCLSGFNPKDKRTFEIANKFFQSEEVKNSPIIGKLAAGITELEKIINEINVNNQKDISLLDKVALFRDVLARDDVMDLALLRDLYNKKVAPMYKDKIKENQNKFANLKDDDVIGDVLIRASQYYPRFMLLLKNLQENTPKEHKDYPQITSLFDSFKTLTEKLDEKPIEKEKQEKEMLDILETKLKAGGTKEKIAIHSHGKVASSSTKRINKGSEELLSLLQNLSSENRKELYQSMATLSNDLSSKLTKRAKTWTKKSYDQQDTALMFNKLTALLYFEDQFRDTSTMNKQFEDALKRTNPLANFFKNNTDGDLKNAANKFLEALPANNIKEKNPFENVEPLDAQTLKKSPFEEPAETQLTTLIEEYDTTKEFANLMEENQKNINKFYNIHSTNPEEAIKLHEQIKQDIHKIESHAGFASLNQESKDSLDTAKSEVEKIASKKFNVMPKIPAAPKTTESTESNEELAKAMTSARFQAAVPQLAYLKNLKSEVEKEYKTTSVLVLGNEVHASKTIQGLRERLADLPEEIVTDADVGKLNALSKTLYNYVQERIGSKEPEKIESEKTGVNKLKAAPKTLYKYVQRKMRSKEEERTESKETGTQNEEMRKYCEKIQKEMQSWEDPEKLGMKAEKVRQENNIKTPRI